MLLRASPALLLFVVACSTAPTETPDASTAPPLRDPALAPSWDPCPTGWVARDGACDPYATEDGPRCPQGQAHFPGEPGCAPIGSPCPSGLFADDLPSSGVRYVAVGATGGDGSRDAPFGTIVEALFGARPGTIIALSKGRFTQNIIRLPSGVTLVGACVAETFLETPFLENGGATLYLGQPDVVVRNVTVGGPHVGIFVLASARLEGVRVSDAATLGIAVDEGGTLTSDRVVIDGTSPGRGDHGVALAISEDSSATISHLVIEENDGIGLAVIGPRAILTLNDAMVRGPSDTSVPGGPGAELFGGAQVRMNRVLFASNLLSGIVVSEGSSLELREAVVRQSGPVDVNTRGTGLEVAAGAQVSGSHVVLRENRYVGLLIGGADTDVEIEDLWITHMRGAASAPRSGVGVAVQGGAHLALERASIHRAIGTGLEGAQAARIELTDISIRETNSDADGKGGRGIDIYSGTTVNGSRVELEANRETGIAAFDPGSDILLEDVLVTATLEAACASDSCPGFGIGCGIAATDGAHIGLRRFELTHHALLGAHIISGTMDLSQGLIGHQPIGVNIQGPPFDTARIFDRVQYVMNSLNVVNQTLREPPSRPLFP